MKDRLLHFIKKIIVVGIGLLACVMYMLSCSVLSCSIFFSIACPFFYYQAYALISQNIGRMYFYYRHMLFMLMSFWFVILINHHYTFLRPSVFPVNSIFIEHLERSQGSLAFFLAMLSCTSLSKPVSFFRKRYNFSLVNCIGLMVFFNIFHPFDGLAGVLFGALTGLYIWHKEPSIFTRNTSFRGNFSYVQDIRLSQSRGYSCAKSVTYDGII
jgi:hypothetical protein